MTTTAAIRAQDFSPLVTDPVRNDWTLGKLRHVIAALDGTPVCITVDRQTGHTLINARLVLCYQHSPGGKVRIETTPNGGTPQAVDYWLFNLGDTIIPLTRKETGPDAKWVALDSYRKERMAAIAHVQAVHGESAGREWGRWEATPYGDGVGVTYTPLPNPPEGKTPGDRLHHVARLDELTRNS